MIRRGEARTATGPVALTITYNENTPISERGLLWSAGVPAGVDDQLQREHTDSERENQKPRVGEHV